MTKNGPEGNPGVNYFETLCLFLECGVGGETGRKHYENQDHDAIVAILELAAGE